MAAAPSEHIVRLTDRGRAAALDARAGQPEPERIALWLEVTGQSGDGYTYELYLMDVAEAEPGDVVQSYDGLALVIPRDSVEKLRGAVIDYVDDPLRPGWALDNPNRPPPMVGIRPLSQASPSPAVGPRPQVELTGDVAERVHQVLERHINPMIAAHGGRADLVGVEGDVAYLRLSGGCQGCGMATVTLGQGIEVAVKEAVPEIARVVDVTDHAAGTNPYFEPSKK